MGGEKFKKGRLQRKQKMMMKGYQRISLLPCQQGEEQANNAVREVRAALQIVNKWFITLPPKEITSISI